MELVLLFLIFFAGIVVSVGPAFALGFAVALYYGRSYWDGAERIGSAPRFVPALRQTFLATWLARGLGYRLTLPEQRFLAGPLLFACRPHGVLVVSAWLTFLGGRLDLPGRRPTLLAVHSVIFALPGLRELALTLGCIDVSRESIERALAHGFSVAVLPGGVREMGPRILPLPDRPGLVSIAYDYDVPLIPVFFKGEEELCWVWTWEPRPVGWLRGQFISWLRIPFPLPFCPRFWNLPTLHTSMGTALRPRTDHASADALNEALKLAERGLVRDEFSDLSSTGARDRKK
jgi:1-acyl-sn-glycerol-3-phosphate acyltransferase